MRKHISVLALWAGSTLGWVLGILLGAAALELALLRHTLSASVEEAPAFETILSDSRLTWVCAAGFLLLCVLLSVSGCALQGSRYTLRRLSIREETATLWKAGYHMICLLLFWAAQLAVALVGCCWYTASLPEAYVSGQTAFLAFYRIGFLHGLLPLDNWLVHLRNAAALLGLGLTTACFSFRQRRGKLDMAPVLLAMVTLWTFAGGISGTEKHVTLLAVAAILAAVEGYHLACSWKGATAVEE